MARKGKKPARPSPPPCTPSSLQRPTRRLAGAVATETTTDAALGPTARTRDHSAAAGTPGRAGEAAVPAGPITRAASRRRALLAVGQHNSTIRPATTMARSAPPTPVGVTTRAAAARMVIGVTTRAAAARLRRAITASAGLSATISNAEVENGTNFGDAAAAAPSPLRGTGITRGRFRRNRRTIPSCKIGDATAAGSECPPAKSSGGNSAGRVNGADQRAKEGSMPSLQHDFTNTKARGSNSRHEKSPRRGHASIPPEVRPAAPNTSLPPGVAARLMVVVAAHARAVAAAAAVKKEPPPAGPAPGAPPASCDQAPTTAVHGGPSATVFKVEQPLHTTAADGPREPVAAQASTALLEPTGQSVPVGASPLARDSVASASTAPVFTPAPAAVGPDTSAVSQPVTPRLFAERTKNRALEWPGEGDTTVSGTGARGGRAKGTPRRHPFS